MKRLRGTGTQHNSPMNRDNAPRPSRPIHHGSGRPLGVLHAPPSPGGAVNRGGTFGMGVLAGKKRK
jgi:hypothetical protein